MKPSYQKDPLIKTVIFDIYGTLLISASGDIDQAEFNTQSLLYALEKANIQVNASEKETQELMLSELLDDFRHAIQNEHEQFKANGIPFPEVDITDIWDRLLTEYDQKGKLSYTGESDLDAYTLLFELLSNKIYPMPHMKEILSNLEERKIPLGIISNAQFYTPIIMNYFLEQQLIDSEKIKHFDPDLTLYSYKAGISKPDFSLFESVKNMLYLKYSLLPEEALYVGNDMRKGTGKKLFH